MEKELKPVKCGCGGEAVIYVTHWWGECYVCECEECGTASRPCTTEAEAITVWNRAMGERTAKVKKFPVVCFDGAYIVLSGHCDCGAVVFNDERNKYCPHCGAELEWE